MQNSECISITDLHVYPPYEFSKHYRLTYDPNDPPLLNPCYTWCVAVQRDVLERPRAASVGSSAHITIGCGERVKTSAPVLERQEEIERETGQSVSQSVEEEGGGDGQSVGAFTVAARYRIYLRAVLLRSSDGHPPGRHTAYPPPPAK